MAVSSQSIPTRRTIGIGSEPPDGAYLSGDESATRTSSSVRPRRPEHPSHPKTCFPQNLSPFVCAFFSSLSSPCCWRWNAGIQGVFLCSGSRRGPRRVLLWLRYLGHTPHEAVRSLHQAVRVDRIYCKPVTTHRVPLEQMEGVHALHRAVGSLR